MFCCCEFLFGCCCRGGGGGLGGFVATENEGTGVIEDIGKVQLGTLEFENNGKKILVVGAKSIEADSKFEGDIGKIIDS
ncbi:MAG: hypothetical protein NWS71_08790, partial [Opitutales bacterium]|nr:hypothetical protein [Opitutales bacterium]